MIPAPEAVRLISSRRRDAVVVSTSTALRHWSALSTRRDLDVDLTDCQDKAADVALGVSLARPNAKVLILDTDAALRTNPGALLTTAASAPSNLVHFLLEDAGHRSTGGSPIPGISDTNFAALAEEAGYPSVHRIDDLEDLALSLEDILKQTGPVFVSIKVIHHADPPPFPSRTMAESMAEVQQALASRQNPLPP